MVLAHLRDPRAPQRLTSTLRTDRPEALNLLIKKIERVGHGLRSSATTGRACHSTAPSHGTLTRPHDCDVGPHAWWRRARSRTLVFGLIRACTARCGPVGQNAGRIAPAPRSGVARVCGLSRPMVSGRFQDLGVPGGAVNCLAVPCLQNQVSLRRSVGRRPARGRPRLGSGRRQTAHWPVAERVRSPPCCQDNPDEVAGAREPRLV
jgi:hypothetical protein